MVKALDCQLLIISPMLLPQELAQAVFCMQLLKHLSIISTVLLGLMGRALQVLRG